MNAIKGWKTVIFNAIMTGLMAWQINKPEASLPGAEQVQSFLDQTEAWIVMGWGLGSILIRVWTNTSIFKKD